MSGIKSTINQMKNNRKSQQQTSQKYHSDTSPHSYKIWDDKSQNNKQKTKPTELGISSPVRKHLPIMIIISGRFSFKIGKIKKFQNSHRLK